MHFLLIAKCSAVWITIEHGAPVVRLDVQGDIPLLTVLGDFLRTMSLLLSPLPLQRDNHSDGTCHQVMTK